jgi:hypothetical protein
MSSLLGHLFLSQTESRPTAMGLAGPGAAQKVVPSILIPIPRK